MMRFPSAPPAVSRPLLFVTIACSAALLSGTASGEAPEPSDDGIPTGAVAFFGSDAGGCPAGWVPAADVMGRLVVGVINEASVGKTVGKPLKDQEDRTHQHATMASIDLPAKSIAGADGSNNQGAQAQVYDVSGSTDPSPSGLPFIQLLACEKQ